MAEEILYNSPALHALKRHQLVSLSKRYGLRASGKNSNLIDRLKEYACTLSPTRQFSLPYPAPTPAHGILSDFAIDTLASPSPAFPNLPQPHSEVTRGKKGIAKSETWEMLSESGASMISPVRERLEEVGLTKSGSVSSWKSAGNGEALSEFGVDTGTNSKSSSVRSLAASISRRASRHLLSKSTSTTSQLNIHAEPINLNEPMEEMYNDLPPSPASTVGIPRRHSTLSLLEKPSTVRLVASPPPIDFSEPRPISDPERDELPFLGTARDIQSLKQRRSMAPIRSSLYDSSNPLSRKSMPALPHTSSASHPSIYPQLPILPLPPMPTIPGAYITSQPTPTKFIFGTNEGTGMTNPEFGELGRTLLMEMSTKMKDRGIVFGEELLKGKRAEVGKLVSVNEEVGLGLGLGNRGRKDRYGEAHQREFARMQSILPKNKLAMSTSTLVTVQSTAPTITETPGFKRKHSNGAASAPNGLPLNTRRESGEPEPKRKRLSTGPEKALGTLREAGKSMVNLFAEGSRVIENSLPRSAKKKRRSSTGHNLYRRFGFLGRKKAPGATPLETTTVHPPVTARPPGPILPRTTSVYAPQDRPQSRPKYDLQASLNRSHTASQLPPLSEGRVAKDRHGSTSAQTTISSTAKAHVRPVIPDFGQGGGSILSGSFGSKSTLNLGLSKTPSYNIHSSMRKASQVDIIRNARPAPAPPATTSENRLPTLNRSSTLYAPTASSIARRQATMRPLERALPLPPLPLDSSTSKFGATSSRPNIDFSANFNLDPPQSTKAISSSGPPKTPHRIRPQGPKSSPAKSPHRNAYRAKASGLSSVKSKGDLRAEAEVQQRRKEIREKGQRKAEERELRDLLS